MKLSWLLLGSYGKFSFSVLCLGFIPLFARFHETYFGALIGVPDLQNNEHMIYFSEARKSLTIIWMKKFFFTENSSQNSRLIYHDRHTKK